MMVVERAPWQAAYTICGLLVCARARAPPVAADDGAASAANIQ